jgi:hypothetical protein
MATSGEEIPDRLKLPIAFDPVELERSLEALADVEWIDHFVTQNYEGNWTVLPLRGPAGAQHPVKMIYSDPTCTEFADTPFLLPRSYFRQIIDALKCPLQSVRLMRLTPGSVIKEHTDHDLAFDQGKVRLHIPITTNPGVEFVLNGTPLKMTPGSCWYLRLADPHQVNNRSELDRVHLVIDAVVDSWLDQLFQRALEL